MSCPAVSSAASGSSSSQNGAFDDDETRQRPPAVAGPAERTPTGSAARRAMPSVSRAAGIADLSPPQHGCEKFEIFCCTQRIAQALAMAEIVDMRLGFVIATVPANRASIRTDEPRENAAEGSIFRAPFGAFRAMISPARTVISSPSNSKRCRCARAHRPRASSPDGVMESASFA